MGNTFVRLSWLILLSTWICRASYVKILHRIITEDKNMNKNAAYALRIVLGGYLVYLGIRILILMVQEKPADMILMCAMSVIFIAVGGGYAGYCIKKVLDIRKEEKGSFESDGAEEDEDSPAPENPNAVRRMNMRATEIRKTPETKEELDDRESAGEEPGGEGTENDQEEK